MILNKKELLEIKGGTITASLLNAIIDGFSLIIELGKSLGSTIRRIVSGKSCQI